MRPVPLYGRDTRGGQSFGDGVPRVYGDDVMFHFEPGSLKPPQECVVLTMQSGSDKLLTAMGFAVTVPIIGNNDPYYVGKKLRAKGGNLRDLQTG